MKRFLKWTALAVGVGVAGKLAYDAVQTARANMKAAVRRVESITEKTQDVLDETQSALRATEQAL